MIKTIWKLLRTAVVVAGVLLTFFAILEVLRAYQILHEMHPWAGYAFWVAVLGLLVWLVVYVWANLAVFPKPLKNPPIADPAAATDKQLKKYLKYLQAFLRRLIANENLSDDDRTPITHALSQLEQQSPGDRDGCISLITQIEQNHIKPALKKLDLQAAKQVRDSMRDIMVGVTLSPYKSADLLIVLYRNLVMIVRIVRVYRVRPAISEQLRIVSDIINVIATVNYINMGKNLIEGLGSRVPGIGRFVDDIAQGIGAGFMTTICGHAAMDRCRAFKGWDEAEAKKHLLSHIGDFYNDVKDIFFKDVWAGVRSRAGVTATETADKVADAINETGSVVNNFIRTPVKVVETAGHAVVDAGSAVVDAGAAGTKAVVHTAEKGVNLAAKTLKKTGDLITKPFKKEK